MSCLSLVLSWICGAIYSCCRHQSRLTEISLLRCWIPCVGILCILPFLSIQSPSESLENSSCLHTVVAVRGPVHWERQPSCTWNPCPRSHPSVPTEGLFQYLWSQRPGAVTMNVIEGSICPSATQTSCFTPETSLEIFGLLVSKYPTWLWTILPSDEDMWWLLPILHLSGKTCMPSHLSRPPVAPSWGDCILSTQVLLQSFYTWPSEHYPGHPVVTGQIWCHWLQSHHTQWKCQAFGNMVWWRRIYVNPTSKFWTLSGTHDSIWVEFYFSMVLLSK